MRISDISALSACAIVANLIMGSFAHAIVMRDDVPESSYTALAAQSQFAPVGLLSDYTDATHTTGITGQVNSGVLIAPNEVLTAAHTLRDSSGNIINGNQVVFQVGGNSYTGSSIVVAQRGQRQRDE